MRPRNSAYGEDVQANGQVELLADEDRPGGWLLLLDRVRQSYVDLEDPTYLEFPYVQALAEVIDALPPGPLDVVHVGGGAATLARWVAATRPASVQFIFEPHDELLRTVLARLPLHPASTVTFRRQDGRRGLADRPPARCDVVVVDAFSGGRVPADLTTTEFFADTARVLRTSGILLLNVTDGPPHTYSRRLIAALAEHFCEIVVFGMADTPVGNLDRRGPHRAVARSGRGRRRTARGSTPGAVRLRLGRFRPFGEAAHRLVPDALAATAGRHLAHRWRVGGVMRHRPGDADRPPDQRRAGAA